MGRKKDSKEKNQAGTALVIFGITGDLAHRKLVPALYQILADKQFSGPLHLIGVARRDWSSEGMIDEFRPSVKEVLEGERLNEELLEKLFRDARYIRAEFQDERGYQSLKAELDSLAVENVLFYLSTPPDAYTTIIENLGKQNLQEETKHSTRIVVEKPYGNDLESAIALDKAIHSVFSEDQVYRIDHYLGKDTVQNILVLRFANAIFEPLWNNHYIDHVQIMVAESIGVGSRTNYYDTAGVIRDIFQNHLMQLLCLVAMEVPIAFEPDAIRDEKVKVLDVLRPLKADEVMHNTVRGQYSAGKMNCEPVPGYQQEVGRETNTETYMAARVFLDNWRWAGVPFYLRSGKRMPERLTQISVHFKQAPIFLFKWCTVTGRAPNLLTINIQPNEGINLLFGAKVPGLRSRIAPVKMDFDYTETFGEEPPEAYQRLLLDAILGDPTLFTRDDEVYAAWAFTTRILEAWQQNTNQQLPQYEAGTWGPKEADEFIGRDGRSWLNSTELNQEGC